MDKVLALVRAAEQGVKFRLRVYQQHRRGVIDRVIAVAAGLLLEKDTDTALLIAYKYAK